MEKRDEGSRGAGCRDGEPGMSISLAIADQPERLLDRRARAPSVWREAAGNYRIFGGCSPILDCEPHFHETFIVAYVKAGAARTYIAGQSIDLAAGMALLVNPYEIIASASGAGFDYDVCYPGSAFMTRAVASKHVPHPSPRFRQRVLLGEDAAAIGAIVAPFREPADDDNGSLSSLERRLADFLAVRPDILCDTHDTQLSPDCVVRACELIDASIDAPLSIDEISTRVGQTRSHFTRAFRDAMGLPPGIFARQLRLARALERIRTGEKLADVALAYGFADQAHFTRAFKRVYGTSPGRLVKDIAHCRHCAVSN